MGIDPGMAICGFGVAEQEAGRRPVAVAFGALRADGLPAEQQLLRLHRALGDLLQEHRPDAVAVERLFFTRNVSTAIGVGQARGVALLAAAEAGVALREFTPTEVKLAATGYGRADKRQMQLMVAALLSLPEPPRPDDAADALAIALCCLQGEPLRGRLQGMGAARP
ncbi:MAG TPA: crossover junction endodeoxyribonuclease RuvC [Bacillota bacterium]|nr:crossover junction endodeoxyribonuclease RuvC [Bacillota bacterium]